MDFSRRIDPFELDVAPDEELPGYEPHTAPTYESGNFEVPEHTYYLRRADRRLQLWVPYGPSTTSSYKVISRGSFRVFSKKADMEMTRTSHTDALEHSVASIFFDNDGPLPWRPRAHFSHIDSHDSTSTYAMESRNFSDWTVGIEGITFAWRLEGKPVSLVLSEKTSHLVIARFTYSRHGSGATNGAEVGELSIYRDGLSVDRDGIEKILASLVVAIEHFKKMGRQYWNDVPVRATSLTREHLPSHRASIASSSNWSEF